jgi:hypothetical protein
MRQKWEKKSCEDGGRDWNDAPRNEGVSRIALCHWKLGGYHGMVSPIEPLEGSNSANTLILYFWTSEL